MTFLDIGGGIAAQNENRFFRIEFSFYIDAFLFLLSAVEFSLKKWIGD